MHYILSIANDIKKEFELFYSHQLPSIETKLRILIEKIKSCSDFDSTKTYLNEIDNIANVLSKLSYKYELDLHVKIDNFIYNYDRILGIASKNYFIDIFNAIKDNKLVI